MGKREDTLQRYVSDMLAVDKHILEAVERQASDPRIQQHSEAALVIAQAERAMRMHVARLEDHLKTLGGDPGSPIKKAVTAALGVGAGLIDRVRPDTVTTALRDDYTALNLAAVSLTLLHTTGLALNDSITAAIAESQLQELAPVIMRINEVIPQVCVQELVDEAETVDTSVAPEAVRRTQKAWRRDGNSV